jgi:L-threonylcarbamoyladenylate synthase
LRIPANPVALALLREAQIPIAAPSANRSTSLSPTQASHVRRSLKDNFDILLDAGPTPGGLESTVLDLTSRPARLLRPGLIPPSQLEMVLGSILRPDLKEKGSSAPLRSPGLLGRHYAPRVPLECAVDDGWSRVQELAKMAKMVGWLTFSRPQRSCSSQIVVVEMPSEPKEYAACFYSALHSLEESKVETIVVAMPPAGDEWLAVRDRLQRAAVAPDTSFS